MTSETISQFSYGHKATGEIASWTRQSGTNTTAYQFGYDGADRLLSAAATVNGSQSPIDAYGYGYDAAGNRTITQSGTAVTTSSFNNLNQVTSGAGNGFLTISGTLNKPGTITVSGTTVYSSGSNNAFTTVAAVVNGSNNISISATNANNNGATYTFPVNVSVSGGGTFSYDLNGNMVNDGVNTYEWDAVNRLTAVNEPGDLRSEFQYDGQGRRVCIVEKNSGTVTSVKNLLWDGMAISEARNQANTITNRYFPQGMQLSGTSFYYTRDHLGSIWEVTDTNAVVQGRSMYDPYGRQTQLVSNVSSDFGYTGDYFHAPSQLCLTLFRAYSPNSGRWISRDPIGDPSSRLIPAPPEIMRNAREMRMLASGLPSEILQGPNLYGYVENAPIDMIDPDGLAPWWMNWLAAVASGYNQSVDIAEQNYDALMTDFPSECEEAAGWAEEDGPVVITTSIWVLTTYGWILVVF